MSAVSSECFFGSLGFLYGTRQVHMLDSPAAQLQALCQCNSDVLKTAVSPF